MSDGDRRAKEHEVIATSPGGTLRSGLDQPAASSACGRPRQSFDLRAAATARRRWQPPRKVEPVATHRPDSYVPAHTLGRPLGLRVPEGDRWSRKRGHTKHSGPSAAPSEGSSAANLRGPFVSLMHTNLRLGLDQTLENLIGAGVPHWTWRGRAAHRPLPQGALLDRYQHGHRRALPAGVRELRPALGPRRDGFV